MHLLIITDILSRTLSELSQLVQISLQRGHFDSKFQVQWTDGRTDGQTDRILIARPRLLSMQRGKKRRR